MITNNPFRVVIHNRSGNEKFIDGKYNSTPTYNYIPKPPSVPIYYVYRKINRTLYSYIGTCVFIVIVVPTAIKNIYFIIRHEIAVFGCVSKCIIQYGGGSVV